MKLPKKIKIGHRVFDVETYKMDDKYPTVGRGYNDPARLIIGVAHTTNDGRKAHESNKKETLLHEIIHGCFDLNESLLSRKAEETAVTNLASNLMTVFKDNPKLKDVFFENR